MLLLKQSGGFVLGDLLLPKLALHNVIATKEKVCISGLMQYIKKVVLCLLLLVSIETIQEPQVAARQLRYNKRYGIKNARNDSSKT